MICPKAIPKSVVVPVKCVVRTAFPEYLEVIPFCIQHPKAQAHTKKMVLTNLFSNIIAII